MTNRLKNKLTTAQEQVKSAYLNGATLREIGDVHNASAGTVRNCLIEMGVTLRSRGRRKKDEEDTDRKLPLDEIPTDAPDTE